MTHRTLGPLFFDRTVGGRFYLLSGRFYPIALAMALDVVGILAISIEQTHEALGAAKGTKPSLTSVMDSPDPQGWAWRPIWTAKS